jgi:hypothetical protein
MGCAYAKEPPPDLSTVDGGMKGGIGSITTKQTGFVLKQKMWSWSGDSFDIKDHEGNIVYKVKGKALSLREAREAAIRKERAQREAERDTMHVSDANDTKVAVLQKKLAASRSSYGGITFQLYSYRYAYIKDNLGSDHWRQIVKLYANSNEESEAVGLMVNYVQLRFISFRCRIKTYATPEEKKAGKEQEIIGLAGETKFFQWESATEMGIELAAGVDSLMALMLCVAAEKTTEEIIAANSSGPGGC